MLTRIVLVGLGNPGERYRLTRHNMGFMLLDHCAREGGMKWSQPAREYHQARGRLHGADAVLLKPKTYVNLSGHALRAFGEREIFSMEDMLVVCDDFNLPLGMMRLRRSGRDGGHNGLASIIEELGINAFPRLRIGIGPLPADVDPADFVLDRFEEGELDRVSSSVHRAAACVEAAITRGIDEAMAEFNTREPRSETD
ncbi:MAG: aminoacyl-tRNA hydrolase [Chitinivibrionia bacterium]|nr:aminoacyl-tRNA hydrolase [Chitinivibrionia bacterium]